MTNVPDCIGRCQVDEDLLLIDRVTVEAAGSQRRFTPYCNTRRAASVHTMLLGCIVAGLLWGASCSSRAPSFLSSEDLRHAARDCVSIFAFDLRSVGFGDVAIFSELIYRLELQRQLAVSRTRHAASWCPGQTWGVACALW